MVLFVRRFLGINLVQMRFPSMVVDGGVQSGKDATSVIIEEIGVVGESVSLQDVDIEMSAITILWFYAKLLAETPSNN